jgi:hypothetical protein
MSAMTLALCNAICDDYFTLADRGISMFRPQVIPPSSSYGGMFTRPHGRVFLRCGNAELRRRHGPGLTDMVYPHYY